MKQALPDILMNGSVHIKYCFSFFCTIIKYSIKEVKSYEKETIEHIAE